MSGVRYEFVELSYGRHAGRVEFEEVDVPFLIVGSNGAGKSTIIEALVRSLYGFRRLRREERRGHRRRRPWSGAEYRATVGLSGPEGAFTFDRDFDSDEVVVRRVGEDPPLFQGEANLARAGETSRRYRDVLRRQIGLADLDAYERTGCVQQGGLIRTELSEDLLRVAAGGHADVESAQHRLRKEYHDLTLEPISEGETRRRKPGRLERLQERVADLESLARAARTAEERRAPLARERDRLKGEADRLQTEIEELEAAFEGVSELETLRTAEEASQGRVRQLEVAGHELDEAMARFDLLQTRDLAEDESVYPADFLARVGAIEDGWWPRRLKLKASREELRTRLAAVAPPGREANLRALAPLVAIIAGLWLLGESLTLTGAVLLLAGLASGVAIWVRRSGTAADRRRLADELSRAEEESRDVEARIESLLEGVPDGGALTPETLPHARREFDRQATELRQREEAELSLRSAMDRASRALEADTAADPEVVGRARDRLREIQRAVSDERDERLAPLKVRLLEASRRRFRLPEGVEASGAAVRASLRERRARHAELREELAELERRIAYEGRPGQSVLALEREMAQLRERLVAVDRRAAAYREASALITRAYEAFRGTDQARLLEAISRHLKAISSGELGPLEAAEGLETARVRAGTRSLPLASPPLSYGQLHMTLLAVRLGAADFLAGLGVRLPLLLDDPFVHLDPRRARELWELLARIATERQVIVATQDRLLVDHLGIEPHLDLDSSPVPGDDRAERTPVPEKSPPIAVPAVSGNGSESSPARGGGDRAGPVVNPEEPSAADPDLWTFLGDDQ